MKKIQVPYGERMQEAFVSDETEVNLIKASEKQPTGDIDELIEAALDAPIASERLEKMVQAGQKVSIVINDATRPSPNVKMEEHLVERLHACGVKDEDITFVVATGTHRAPTEAELPKVVSPAYIGKIKIVSHDCMDPSQQAYIGTTSQNVPIWINKAVAEADFVITTGLIAPHQSAGFSGGRKSIVPGVAGFETLRIHHSLPIRPFNPSLGKLKDNPFHDVAVEGAKLAKVRFILNAVQDPYKQNVAFVAGDLTAAHETGAGLCRKLNTVHIPGKADVVVTSPGGAPRDGSLYQAQKSLAIAEIMGKAKGCTYIVCAECGDGIGGDILKDWLTAAKTPEEAIEKFTREGFYPGTNKVFLFARALSKGRVIIVTENIPEKVLNDMMMEWAPDLETALKKAEKDGKLGRLTVIPSAVSLIPDELPEA